jgi:hypothetical protein
MKARAAILTRSSRPACAIALAFASFALLVACGGSSAPEVGDEGALEHCADDGVAPCGSDVPVVKVNGWDLPEVVQMYTEKFDVDPTLLREMTPLETNPHMVEASVVSGPSHAQGVVCNTQGTEYARCSFSLLVQADTVKDLAGHPVRQTFAYKPVVFTVHGQVAKRLALLSPTAKVGPLQCHWSGDNARCDIEARGIGGIVSPFTPNSAESKAAVEASMDPPTR